jgi:hypothetical protein
MEKRFAGVGATDVPVPMLHGGDGSESAGWGRGSGEFAGLGREGVECGGCECDAGDCGGAFDGDGVLCCRECEAILSLQMSLLPLFWFVHIVRSVRNRC